MIAIGAGGLDVAVAMAGGRITSPCPRSGIELKGRLPLACPRRISSSSAAPLSVKGGVAGSSNTSAKAWPRCRPERATITNMGELGATTSIFPSDEVTRAFLRRAVRRILPLAADPDAGMMRLSPSNYPLQPLAAMPHSPDNVSRPRDRPIRWTRCASAAAPTRRIST